ncbi:MAG TPA: class I SAM-dependent methyltransferase [Polyangiaceae bacterium]|nr:class I SAM-dependent methyltransferase [Polyangiaceae bacterium]
MVDASGDRWAVGNAYDRYMGRWSRLMAREFLGWLQQERGAHWLELGCGTGALTSGICERCEPATIVACDQSASFIEHARASVVDARASFVVADATALPARNEGFDVVVSGLVLNFIPDPVRALTLMRERVRAGGTVAAYVWDYLGGLEFLQHFWDEAKALDSNAAPLDEARRFSGWQLFELRSHFAAANLGNVESTVLRVETTFANFEDYWQPFLGGAGPAPSYVATLTRQQRDALAERLRARLPFAPDGSLRLGARAFALRAQRGLG